MNKYLSIFSNFITMISFCIPNRKQRLNYQYLNFINLIFLFFIFVDFICLYGFIKNITNDFILSLFLLLIFLGLSFILYFVKVKFYITYKNNLFINQSLNTLVNSLGLF